MGKIAQDREKAIDALVIACESVSTKTAKSVARLVLVVDYDETPGRDDLEELLDKARELGGVEIAEFLHHAATRESLV